jgi:hypothetical protein
MMLLSDGLLLLVLLLLWNEFNIQKVPLCPAEAVLRQHFVAPEYNTSAGVRRAQAR